MPHAQTFKDAFDVGLVTFSELRILQVLDSFLWYEDSEVFPNLKTLSTQLRLRCKSRRGQPKRGYSPRHIRRCLANVEERLGLRLRAPRYRQRACNRRQTSNAYDVRGLSAALEQRVIAERSRRAEAPHALGHVAFARSTSSHPSPHMSALEEISQGNSFDHESSLPPYNNTPPVPSFEPVVVEGEILEGEGVRQREDDDSAAEDLKLRLLEHAVAPFFAWRLVSQHDGDTIRLAIRALEEEQRERRRRHRKLIEHPGKWLYRAITENWTFARVRHEPEAAPPPVQLEEQLEVAKEEGNAFAQAGVLVKLAEQAADEGRRGEPLRLLEEAAELYRSVGLAELEGRVLGHAGAFLQEEGRFEEARDRYERALKVLRGRSRKEWTAFMLARLAAVARELGDMATVRGALEEQLALWPQDEVRREHVRQQLRELGL